MVHSRAPLKRLLAFLVWGKTANLTIIEFERSTLSTDTVKLSDPDKSDPSNRHKL